MQGMGDNGWKSGVWTPVNPGGAPVQKRPVSRGCVGSVTFDRK